MATRPAEARVTVAAIAVVGAVVCAQIAAHLVDYGVYGLRVDALNSNVDTSAVAWITPFALAVATLGSLGLSASRRAERARWAALSALLGLLFTAGAFHFDEHVPHWRILVGPILGTVLVLLLTGARRLGARPARLVGVGCALLVVSVGLHLFGAHLLSALGWSASTWPYQIKVAVKEATEIAGWLLLATALCVSVMPFDRRPRPAASRPPALSPR